MRCRRALGFLAAALVLLAAACGDDAATSTTAASTTAAATTQATATTAVTTTTEATTTTTEATTTTTDEHPAWAVSWAALWPEDGATATYRVNLWGGGSLDLPARIEYGVEWQDGTWDRITIGTVAPGEWGVALYFARPEPWVLTIWGLEASAPGFQGSILEYSEEPGVLDLRGLPDGMARIDAGVIFDAGGGEAQQPMTGTYALSVVGLETVEVAAGTMEDAVHLNLNLGGEFFGAASPDEFTEVADIWILPGQLIVKWGRPAPNFESIELLSLWA